jgi:hypothetical protein
LGCSTSTTTGGTGVCSTGCQLAVVSVPEFVVIDDDDE